MSKTSSYLLPQVRQAQGKLQLPGSKSISNRALLLAAMTSGHTRLTGVLESDDTEVMLDSLAQLGITTQRLQPSSYEVQGGDRKSTRLNSSHVAISYAVFCLTKKINQFTVSPNSYD